MNNICTVILITYNHVKYIEKAIESVLMQKTKYNYIIHIFDDASTDGTSDIVRKYAKKYPDKIIPFISEKNQSAQTNFWNAYKSVKTKYCALIECDDYWCNENKLELQIEALEEHPECSFCACQTIIKNVGDEYRTNEDHTFMVTNNMIQVQRIIPKENLFDIQDGYMNHIGSRLIRTKVIDFNAIKNKEIFLYDNCQFYYLLLKGSMYYINKAMHCYVQTGKGAFSGAALSKRMQTHIKNLIAFNEETNLVISDLVFKDIRNFLNYYSYIQRLLIIKERGAAEVQKEEIQVNSLDLFVAKCQKIKRYILPRFVIDIIDIPFNLIKLIGRKIRK